MNERSDVAIIGGGLAGLTLAIQLKNTISSIDVKVFEKSFFPQPAKIHKIGESMVEISSWYLSETLGLRELLLRDHLPKFGLRFFMANGESDDICFRPEYGLMDIPGVPDSINQAIPGVHLTTFNVDRGKLENQLYHICKEKGVEIIEGVKITSIDIASPHKLTVINGISSSVFQSRWIIDCTGGTGILANHLKVRKKYPHFVNAAWFRINRRIDPDEMSNNSQFLDRTYSSMRWLSTNHFMGQAYWIWVIPLPGNATSVGIMADPNVHPFQQMNTPEGAFTWLKREEPVLFEAVNKASLLDFSSRKMQSYYSIKTFSTDRWALSGESGYITDALYSPGGDFIAVGNTLITEMIISDLEKQRVRMATMIRFGEQLLKGLFNHYTGIFRDTYMLTGRPATMLQKVAWDTAVYFGYNVALFRNNQFCNPSFHRQIINESRQLENLQKRMIGYFRNYKAKDHLLSQHFIDQAHVRTVQKLYLSLEQPLNPAELKDQIAVNMKELEYFTKHIEKLVA